MPYSSVNYRQNVIEWGQVWKKSTLYREVWESNNPHLYMENEKDEELAGF